MLPAQGGGRPILFPTETVYAQDAIHSDAPHMFDEDNTVIGSLRRPNNVRELALYARAQESYYAAHFFQLRCEPDELKRLIEAEAESRRRLIEDKDEDALSVGDLRDNPRHIGLLIRDLVRNTLFHLGTWSYLAQCLEDIEELDCKVWINGTEQQRSDLWTTAHYILSFQIQAMISRIHTRQHRALAILKKYNPDWDVLLSIFKLNVGAFGNGLSVARFILCSDLRRPLGMSHNEARDYLLSAFKLAPRSDLDDMNEIIVEELTELANLVDFGRRIGLGEYPVGPSADSRCNKSMKGRKLLRRILDSVDIEKDIKDISSLSDPLIFARIWKAIDRKSKWLGKGLVIERIIGFFPTVPSWHAWQERAPVSKYSRSRSSFPSPSCSPSPPRQQRSRSPLFCQPVSEPGPYISPFRTRPYEVEVDRVIESVSCFTIGVAAPRRGRQRRAGVAEEAAEVVVDVIQLPASLPHFWLSKRVYSTFERIFSKGKEKGQLGWNEFEYAIMTLGFVKEHKTGSIVHFNPLLNRDRPFVCHRPHGKVKELSPVRLRQYAHQLNDLYGWTLEWFALRSMQDHA